MAQHAILRFEKHKGNPARPLEAHHERQKEQYASNPDIDTSRSNTKKLSPKTNHTGKKNCGNGKGGLDRTDFFRKCESSFDRCMGFDREPEESFDYLNAV